MWPERPKEHSCLGLAMQFVHDLRLEVGSGTVALQYFGLMAVSRHVEG